MWMWSVGKLGSYNGQDCTAGAVCAGMCGQLVGCAGVGWSLKGFEKGDEWCVNELGLQ
jgi:hypothetical protein